MLKEIISNNCKENGSSNLQVHAEASKNLHCQNISHETNSLLKEAKKNLALLNIILTKKSMVSLYKVDAP